jgi:hypothetical protein
MCDLYNHLTTITANEECRKGCQHGTGICPDEWYPSQADSCSAECGRVVEEFWDQCGEMLKNANIDGMVEMDQFYTHCLEELYPPGTCGTFCTEKTYECYLAEMHEACCDEEGTNCIDGQPIPQTCPDGCAQAFPKFLEACRDFISSQDGSEVVDEFDTFEDGCNPVCHISRPLPHLPTPTCATECYSCGGATLHVVQFSIAGHLMRCARVARVCRAQQTAATSVKPLLQTN